MNAKLCLPTADTVKESANAQETFHGEGVKGGCWPFIGEKPVPVTCLHPKGEGKARLGVSLSLLGASLFAKQGLGCAPHPHLACDFPTKANPAGRATQQAPSSDSCH